MVMALHDSEYSTQPDILIQYIYIYIYIFFLLMSVQSLELHLKTVERVSQSVNNQGSSAPSQTWNVVLLVGETWEQRVHADP